MSGAVVYRVYRTVDRVFKKKSQSASIFRCTSVLPRRLEWWQIIDKSYSGVLYGTKIFRISTCMVIMYTHLSITR